MKTITKIHNNNATPDSGRNQSVFVRGLQYFFKLIRSIFTRHSAEKIPAAVSSPLQTVVKPAEQGKILQQNPPALPAGSVDLTQYAIPEEFHDEIAKKSTEKHGLELSYSRQQGKEKYLFDKQKQLQQDVESYFSTLQVKARPDTEALVNKAATMKSEKTLIECLYAQTEGIVIGEQHKSSASKHFIIDNIKTLKKKWRYYPLPRTSVV